MGSQVDKDCRKIRPRKNGLLKAISITQLYQRNKEFFEALSIYITLPGVKIEELQQKTYPEAMQA